MAYCGPRGLPLSTFLSWRQDDQDAALLWTVRQQQTCQQCGTHPEHWDPELGGHPRAWVATVHSCPGCAALEQRRTRFDKQVKDGEVLAGSRVVLRRQVPQEGGRP